MTGHKLVERLQGCETIIDVSNQMLLSRKAAVRFFGTVTSNLLDAGARAGIGHFVALSIVGADKVDTGYYMGKRWQDGPAGGSCRRSPGRGSC